MEESFNKSHDKIKQIDYLITIIRLYIIFFNFVKNKCYIYNGIKIQ